jgi:hypothetical protein
VLEQDVETDRRAGMAERILYGHQIRSTRKKRASKARLAGLQLVSGGEAA